jgi:S-adenosylmethionine synthetase
MGYLWTSEAVSKGHPDKVADQIADTILDAYLIEDPLARVACEVTCCYDLVLVTGEVGRSDGGRFLDHESLTRAKLIEIGYDRREHCYSGHDVTVLDKMNTQSHEIAAAVVKESGELGAGDQGMMFGFACDETPSFMPLAHNLCFQVLRCLEEDITSKRHGVEWGSALLPDAKSQVTLEYGDQGIERIATLVVSAQHCRSFALDDLRHLVRMLIQPVLDPYEDLIDDRTVFHINPAGSWHHGGPSNDTGLSGRKIVVDNYGADCPIGGGSFSGKDPSKVDRSGAYAARHLAKNIVASGLARRCQIQLAYAIGVVDPVSIRINTLGTGRVTDHALEEFVHAEIPFSPRSIIDRLGLRRPIFARTASGGHFGRDGFPWEELDLVDALRAHFPR